MTALGPHLTAFFEQRLPLERGASVHTRDSYAYAFKLLVTFASHRLTVTPSQLTVEQIDAALVTDFLHDLEQRRGHRPSSRNVRLAAIKSFMHFLEYRLPSALDQIRRILAIPTKQTTSRLVRHLTTEEMQAILDPPDPTTWSGIRDRALLHLCYAGGLRVSELIGVTGDDLLWQPQPTVRIHGTTAMPVVDREACVATRLETHLCTHGVTGDQGPARGIALAGARAFQTTEVYTRADPAVKLEALEAVMPPTLRSGRFKASDQLIASLTTRTVMRSDTRTS